MSLKVAIVGGGASGMMAAISAARNGAEVTIYERLDRVGKKILATGNGRCNLTNRHAGISDYHGKNTKFLMSAISQFWIEETLSFFEELGIVFKEEDAGKMYPYSEQASSVLDVLRMELQRLSVTIIPDFEVEKIQMQKDGFSLISYKKQKAFSNRVIIATGGKAAPNLGSNGSGYTICEALGHHITALAPSLVQLKCENTKGLQGLKINAKATLQTNSKSFSESTGEVLFTDYGLSGPPIFHISAYCAFQKNLFVSLDLMPEHTQEEIISLLYNRKTKQKNLEAYLVGMLPKKIACAVLKHSGLSPLSRSSDSLSKTEIIQLAHNIKNWEFPITGTQSWNNAQVTAGGVLTEEINPSTMESKKVPGIYLTGELLDIDGNCGGYNLQWAWSSGYIAGVNASKN